MPSGRGPPSKRRRKAEPEPEPESEDEDAHTLATTKHTAVNDEEQTFVVVFAPAGRTPFGDVSVSRTEFIGRGFFSRVVRCHAESPLPQMQPPGTPSPPDAFVVKKAALSTAEEEEVCPAKLAAREWYFLSLAAAAGIDDIVRLHHSYLCGPHLYMVLTSYQRPVSSLVDTAANEALSADVRKVVMRALSSALSALHHLGVMHRDVKPGNILVTSDLSCAVLCDLSSAAWIDATHERETPGADSDSENSSARLTPAHGVTTRPYCAPESLDAGDYDEKVDIWGIGCVLAEMLRGAVLFPRAPHADAAFLEAQRTVVDPAALRSAHPEATEEEAELLQSTLCIDPAGRLSAAEVLRRVAGGGRAAARKPKAPHGLPPLPSADQEGYLRQHVESRERPA